MSHLSERLLRESTDRYDFIMVEPTHFGVDYEINPWMDKSNKVNPQVALEQWNQLAEHVAKNADSLDMIVCPVKDMPDIVFVANAGTFIPAVTEPEGTYNLVISHFRYPERKREAGFYEKALQKYNPSRYLFWSHVKLNPDGTADLDVNDASKAQGTFEGDGDALRLRDKLLVGTGFRSSNIFLEQLAKYVYEPNLNPNRDPFYSHGLHEMILIDPRFYHLDTCFFYHSYAGAEVCWFYPEAFSPESRKWLAKLCQDMFIPFYELSRAEALEWQANAVGAKSAIIGHKFSSELKTFIMSQGLGWIETPLDQFHKAGGSAKCMTLRVPASTGAQIVFQPTR